MVNHVYAELSKLVAEHNALQPISKLPPEILAQIFSRLSTRQRVFMGRTSRSWRDVLNSWPNVWKFVKYSARKFKHKDALARLLELSGQAEFVLQLDVRDQHLEEICHTLEVNLHRCIEMRLYLHGGEQPRVVGDRLTAALHTAAPRLSRFYLFDVEQVYNRAMSSSLDLFAGHAPELRVVKAQCNIQSLRWSTNAFRSVTDVVFSPSGLFQVSDLETVKELFPAASAITFDVDDWEGDEATLERVVQFESTLKTLSIIANNDANYGRRVLDHISLWPIQRIWIWFNQHAESTDDGLILDQLCATATYASQSSHDLPPAIKASCGRNPFIARTMSFEFSTVTGHPLNIYMYDQHIELLRKVFRCIGQRPRNSPPPCGERTVIYVANSAVFEASHFANVTRLYFTETSINHATVHEPIPPLPSLVHLTIYTVKAESHLLDHVFSAFTSAEERWRRPALAGASRSSAAIQASLSAVVEEENDTRGSESEDEPVLRGDYFVLQCPVLEIVEVVTRCPASFKTPPTRLTPESICAYVEVYLHYDRPLLRRLELTGLDLEVGDPMAFERMLQLAEEVLFDDQLVQPRYSTPDHLSWT